MIYYGIDVHKYFSQVTAVDEVGKVLGCSKVANSREAWESFFNLHRNGGSKAVMEATFNWYYLFELLEGQVDEILLAHPLRVKAIASAKIKTDKIDSEILAQLLRADLIPQAYIPAREDRDVREILRYRASLVGIRTRIKNKIHALLDKNGIKTPEFSDLFGKEGEIFLKKLEIREPYRTIIDGYLEFLNNLKAAIYELDSQIRKLSLKNEATKLLMTIPGVGYYSALLLYHEIGDIDRFASAKKLASYAGLSPSVYASGNRIVTGHITKMGNKWIRWILTECAQMAVRHDEYLRHMYRKIRSKHGKQTGCIAVARKLVTAVYHIMKYKEEFKGEKLISISL